MDHDTLSDVLRSVRLRGAVFFYVSGSSDWAAEAPPAREIAPLLMRGVEHVIEYHVVAAGTCWAAHSGRAVGAARRRRRRHVSARRRARHVERARACAARRPRLVRRSRTVDRLPVRLAYRRPQRVARGARPTSGADTTIVCGFLGCDLQPFNPLIAALPRLLHLRADDDDAWIAQFTQQAVAESHAQRPGGEAMLARMSEMMFVDAVRRYADRLPADSAGWLAGLRDRFVGRALALHARAAGARLDDRRARPRASACRARRCTSASSS